MLAASITICIHADNEVSIIKTTVMKPKVIKQIC